MTISELVTQLKSTFEGFSPAASKEDLRKLEQLMGPIPADLLALYNNHDGSPNAPGNDEGFLAARLMPISEVLDTNEQMAHENLAELGKVVWLWNDDAGNLLGLYTTGLFSGWLTKYDHEESLLIPAYRSIHSFMKAMLSNATFPDEDARACDLIGLERDIPAIHMDDPIYVASDKKLREQCVEMADKCDDDENVRMLYVMSIIALTPVTETERLTDFFEVEDIWIPEAAVRLMDMREYYDAIPAVEKLAKESDGNAVSAATRMLVRADNEKAKAAVERLKTSLKGTNLQWLNQWLDGRGVLRAPGWY